MKKLLTLAILPAIFFAQSCFGQEPTEGRFLAIVSTHAHNLIYDIGYEWTDNFKISIGPSFQIYPERGLRFGILANFYYNHKLAKTNISPYISAGIGAGIDMKLTDEDKEGVKGIIVQKGSEKLFLPLKISAGASLPIFSRTNIFAGYGMRHGSDGFDHGIELGISMKL